MPAARCREAPRQIIVDHHRAGHHVGLGRDVDRRAAADHVGFAEAVGARHRVAARASARAAVIRAPRRFRSGVLGLSAISSRRRSTVEHLDSAEVVVLLALRDEAFQFGAPLGPQQVLGRDLTGDLAREVRGVVGRAQVVDLRDVERVVEHALVFGIEPARNVGAQKRACDHQQEQARHQRHRDEAEHQANLELGADEAAAMLEDDLGQVASDQQQKQPEEQEAYVEQQNDDQVGDQGGVAGERRQFSLREHEGDQHGRPPRPPR